MPIAIFYHLTASDQLATLTQILPKALDQGWRVMIRHPDALVLQSLDQDLWLGADGSFLAHGIAGGAHDALQPVLLGHGPITNQARGLFLLGGAELLASDVDLERIWLIFDGSDPTAVDRARAQWQSLTAAGMAAQYWAEEDGRWQKKHEKPAA